MAVYVVGDFLRETRLRRGYTQEEVSYGICTPASLSRIENGAQKPGRLILEKLFERLGTENNLFNSFVSREEMELYSAIQTLIRNVTDAEIEKIEEKTGIMQRTQINRKRISTKWTMRIRETRVIVSIYRCWQEKLSDGMCRRLQLSILLDLQMSRSI